MATKEWNEAELDEYGLDGINIPREIGKSWRRYFALSKNDLFLCLVSYLKVNLL